MESEGTFLGKGWAFPPRFDKNSRTVEMVFGEEDIRQSLHILLSTSVGERVMQPLFGCNLRDHQYEPLNNTYMGFLIDLVTRAIRFFEPRIKVEDIRVTDAADAEVLEGKLWITIEYVISRTNTRSNFVFPFYLREADREI